VSPGRLRFDFTYPASVEPDELERVEELVNRWSLAALDTVITPDRELREAVAAGAMALFGEKYGERVRTVEVPPLRLDGDEELASLELCGGCHVRNTGEVGFFVILAERGIASGVRRIEALTGEAAWAWVRDRRRALAAVESELGAAADAAPGEIAALKERARELERQVARLRRDLVSGEGRGDHAGVVVDGVKVLAREVPPAPANEVREMADALRSRLGSGVVVLASREEGKVSLVAAVTADLVDRLHAGRLAGRIAEHLGGKGGGRADFAQAGGREPDRLPAALAAVPDAVREALGISGPGSLH
jgi:alanyl-tRNA synthetase